MSVYPEGRSIGRHARISDDGLYRYQLERTWAAEGLAGWAEDNRLVRFIMLNPSTADADIDDPTVRRCVGFARALGAGRLVVLNLYAYRATKPADLWRADDPVGDRNDATLYHHAVTAGMRGDPIIAAWGANAKPDRIAKVRNLVEAAGAQLTSLGVTKAGAPRHPLYVKGDTAPEPWPAS